MDWKRKLVTSQNLYISNGQLVFLIWLAMCYKQNVHAPAPTVLKDSRSEVNMPIVL